MIQVEGLWVDRFDEDAAPIVDMQRDAGRTAAFAPRLSSASPINRLQLTYVLALVERRNVVFVHPCRRAGHGLRPCIRVGGPTGDGGEQSESSNAMLDRTHQGMVLTGP